MLYYSFIRRSSLGPKSSIVQSVYNKLLGDNRPNKRTMEFFLNNPQYEVAKTFTDHEIAKSVMFECHVVEKDLINDRLGH